MEEKVLPLASGELIKTDVQEIKNSEFIDNLKEFDIQEVENTSDDEGVEVEDGGVVDLGRHLDSSEKSHMRRYITYHIMSISTVWVLIGLIQLLLTGNSFLLAASMPMSIPLLVIIRYYFRND